MPFLDPFGPGTLQSFPFPWLSLLAFGMYLLETEPGERLFLVRVPPPTPCSLPGTS